MDVRAEAGNFLGEEAPPSPPPVEPTFKELPHKVSGYAVLDGDVLLGWARHLADARFFAQSQDGLWTVIVAFVDGEATYVVDENRAPKGLFA